MPPAKSAKKRRADELVHELGLAESRTKAQALIMAGRVFLRSPGAPERELVKKAGQLIPPEAQIESDVSGVQDVGRGAQKLRRALEAWPEISVRGTQALDIGSSTGGFTQVLLEAGAARVVALDVGTNQLHERLRSDPRVVSLEQHHVLRMEASDWERAGVTPAFDVIVMDVSFISVTKIIATGARWLKPGGSWVILVKPQFEVGPKKAPGGIVKNPEYHKEALEIARASVREVPGLEWKEVVESPIQGGDGNKEFLAWIRKS